jgi:hypothetical protein
MTALPSCVQLALILAALLVIGFVAHFCLAMTRAVRLLAEIRDISSLSRATLESAFPFPVPDAAFPELLHFGGLMYRIVAPEEGPSPVREEDQNVQSTGICDFASSGSISSDPSEDC